MGRRYIASKWSKTNVLLKNKNLRKYVPVTKRMTKSNLKDMLNKYNMVYIKPDRGSLGIGVMRLEKTGHTSYRYRSGSLIRTFSSYDKFYSAIKKRTGKRFYLVQKGIHMLKYHGSPFDIRVMVQKNPREKWEVTGKVGRVAQRGKVVTNQHRGGKVYTLKTLLSHYFPSHKRKTFTARLDKLGLDVAKHLQKKYTGIKELGIDVALDQRKKPWILEVNTSPGIIIFRKLKDKRMYYKMVTYGQIYGRRRY